MKFLRDWFFKNERDAMRAEFTEAMLLQEQVYEAALQHLQKEQKLNLERVFKAAVEVSTKNDALVVAAYNAQMKDLKLYVDLQGTTLVNFLQNPNDIQLPDSE